MQFWQRLSGRYKQALRVFVLSSLTALVFFATPVYQRLELSFYDKMLEVYSGHSSRVDNRLAYYTIRDSSHAKGLAGERLFDAVERLGKAGVAKVVILNPEVFGRPHLPFVMKLPDYVDWLDTDEGGSGHYEAFLEPGSSSESDPHSLENLYDMDGNLRGIPWDHPSVEYLLKLLHKENFEKRGPRLMLKPVTSHQDGLSGQDLAGDSPLETIDDFLKNLERQGRLGEIENLKGKVVLIGMSTAEAANFAEINTSNGNLTAGHIYLQLGQAIADDWVPTPLPDWMNGLLFIVLVGGLSLGLSGRTPTTVSLYGLPSLILVCCLAALLPALQLTAPMAGILVGMLLALFYLVLLELIRSKKVLSTFGGAEDAAFEGKEAEATMLFTNLPPFLMDMERDHHEALLEYRRQYNEILARIATRYHGKVLDYQGDAQMLGFGLRYDEDDHEHPAEATAAALEIVHTVSELAERWKAPPEKVKVHVGVCTGSIALGHLGAVQKQDIAAIGDTTNTAARLMGAAMKQNVPVLVSKPTFELADGLISGEELPPVELKGKSAPVEVYAARAVNDVWQRLNLEKVKDDLTPRGGTLEYKGSRQSDFLVTVLLGWVGFLLTLVIWNSSVLDESEVLIGDTVHRYLGQKRADQRIVIAGIDETTLRDSRLARFPWSRGVYAQVIRNLEGVDHKGLFFDIMFKKERADDPDGDAALASALADDPRTVVAAVLFKNERNRLEDPRLFPAADYDLLRRRHQLGLIHCPTDVDGVVRFGYLTAKETDSHDSVEADKRRVYPSAAAAMILSEGSPLVVGENEVVVGENAYPATVIGDERSAVRIRFGPSATADGLPPQEGAYRLISFNRLLDPADPIFGELEGKYILVGQAMTTGEGNDIDRIQTVVGNLKGVEVHARVLDNLLNQDCLQSVPTRVTSLLLMLVCGLTIWVLTVYRQAKTYARLLVTLSFLLLALYLLFFSVFGIVGEIMILWTGIVVVTVAVMVGRYILTFRALTRVIPAEVAAELMFYHAARDRRQVATILLTDIRGYTTLSEGRTAVAMLDVLNEYHKRTVACYDRHGGQALTYQGDAQIVIFGVFGNRKNPAADAVAAALGLQAICDELRQEWGIESRDDFDVGAGLCTGEVEVGLLGGGTNLQYSVVGETVRKAHKVQSLSADLEAPVILDEETFEAASGAVEVDDLGMVQPKGLPHEIRLYRAKKVKE